MAADSLLLLTLHRDRLLARDAVPIHADTWVELYEELHGFHVQTLVCGGIAIDTRRILHSKKLNIIDNVACTAEEAVNAIVSGTLDRGYGFETQLERDEEKEISKTSGGNHSTASELSMNCLSCEDRRCQRGESCILASLQSGRKPEETGKRALSEVIDADELRCILDAATDISAEHERILCRVSELVYFCLEMEYRRIGIAFCMDLIDPTRTLATLLERFFEVFPVGCKIGAKAVDDPFSPALATDGDLAQARIACNPVGQAEALNRIGTDLNVVVGLCMGHDCIFNRMSHAPVTTLFVKDRSLANNPIGAMYSDYYLREVSKAPAFRP